ncbi:MAG TPA: hypothetical protein VK524_00135 [Polyangiaceae bacterium]|nr:hypothetical protein [Polyangiaceae bacterium]
MKRFHARLKLALSACAIVSYALVAQGDVPSFFVPLEQCTTQPCACPDLRSMKAFLADQIRARDVWKTVRNDIQAGTGPATSAAARALFNSRLGAASPEISTQYQSCPGYDPSKNTMTIIAGVNASGVSVFDPCFCGAFCSDIVQSTLAHEKMHVTSGVILTAGSLHMLAFCKAFSHPDCAKLEPLTLAVSEIVSHDAGIEHLQQAIRKLLEATEDCTTDGGAPSPIAPTGLGNRVQSLFSRFVHGAPPR